MENSQRLALRHHGHAQVVGARSSRHVVTERCVAVRVDPVYFPGPQSPTVAAQKAVLLPRRSWPESDRIETVVGRPGTAKVQRACIGREQGVNKFGDFGVAFLGSEGRLEEVALLKERMDFTSAGIQFVE